MELEDCLQAVRAEVADVFAIGGLDESYDDVDLSGMGLDSLCAVELLARLRDKHGIQISVRTIFEHRTIRGLAELVYGARDAGR